MQYYHKKGLILIYPGFQNEAKLYQYNRLIEEFEKLGIKIDKIKVDEINIAITNNELSLKLEEYDFCIQLVKDKYINSILEKNNIRCFNTYNAIEGCDDKMLTYCVLAGNKIKMPKTISVIQNNGIENITENVLTNEQKNNIEKFLGYPLIVKKSDSKGGRDIYKVDNRQMLDDVCLKLASNKYIFQEFISTNVGKDVRTMIVGGKFVEAFMRVNEKDFRSNISLGGKALPYTITEEYRNVAEKVAKILKLDYCSVDFFLADENEPIVCEVNADPAIWAIEKLKDTNVAKVYAEYIYNEIYKCGGN